MNTDTRTYQFQAKSDIWTGSVQFKMKDSKPKEQIPRLIQTGLLGSIRWWFEVVVRGLGGGACDPNKSVCKDTKHCVACEFFGCTGWARKFRFQVLDENGSIKESQIKKDDNFKLQFIPLRPVKDEEWALLDLTLRIISNYAALGGKTVFKPSDEKDHEDEKDHKKRSHHSDFGIIKFLPVEPQIRAFSKKDLETYVRGNQWLNVKMKDFEWASFNYFWVVDEKYLSRQDKNKSTFNDVIGRKGPKFQSKYVNNDPFDKWLAGGTKESKKVFSFKNPPRTFGFINPKYEKQFGEMLIRLKKAWPDMKDEEFMVGDGIFNSLLKGGNS